MTHSFVIIRFPCHWMLPHPSPDVICHDNLALPCLSCLCHEWTARTSKQHRLRHLGSARNGMVGDGVAVAESLNGQRRLVATKRPRSRSARGLTPRCDLGLPRRLRQHRINTHAVGCQNQTCADAYGLQRHHCAACGFSNSWLARPYLWSSTCAWVSRWSHWHQLAGVFAWRTTHLRWPPPSRRARSAHWQWSWTSFPSLLECLGESVRYFCDARFERLHISN